MQTTHAAFGQCPFYKGPYPRQQKLLFPPARQQHRAKSTAHGRGDKNSGGEGQSLNNPTSGACGKSKSRTPNMWTLRATSAKGSTQVQGALGSRRQAVAGQTPLNFRLKIHKKMPTASKCTNRHSFNCASKCRKVAQIPEYSLLNCYSVSSVPSSQCPFTTKVAKRQL